MLGSIFIDGGLVRLHLRGTLDSAGTALLRDGLAALAERRGGDVVLDFSDVTFIDGSLVAAIAYLFKRMAADARMLRIVSATGQPLAMLNRLGLCDVLAVAGSAPRSAPGRGRWPGAWAGPSVRGAPG